VVQELQIGGTRGTAGIFQFRESVRLARHRLSKNATDKTNSWNDRPVPSLAVKFDISQVHIVSSAEKYRRQAQECLRIAQTSRDDDDRAIWISLAQAWARLAEHDEGREDPHAWDWLDMLSGTRHDSPERH
jgi:hypothetical protein